MQRVRSTSSTRKAIDMVKQFIITMKEPTKYAIHDEQRFVDWVRRMPEVESVMPILEMGRPMTEEALQNIRRMKPQWEGILYSNYIQSLLDEADRARIAELVTQKALQVYSHTQKELEVKISVLEQRLAQLGVVEEKRAPASTAVPSEPFTRKT